MKSRLAPLARRLPISPPLRRLLRVSANRLLGLLGYGAALPGVAADQLERPAPGSGLDFFFLGIIDWHFRFQRPQQLATRLAARGHRVFYCSSNFIDQRGHGFRVERLDPDRALWQVYLGLRHAPDIYSESPSPPQAAQLGQGLEDLVRWVGARRPVLVLGHPFWWDGVKGREDALLIYDRMDFHAGFGAYPAALTRAEEALMRDAALTLSSSAWLDEDTARFTPRHRLIRNGADYAHFSAPCERPYQDPQGRRLIGYFGAIATWLDLALVRAVADRFPSCAVVLIGHDQIGLRRRLSGHPNLVLLDEVPYCELPNYLCAFDVCLLPRLLTPLTRAMNPVKLYEYLCSGRPVVATDLPELSQFDGLVYRADSREGFLEAVQSALDEAPDDPRRALRKAFAAGQTWDARAAELEREVLALLDGGSRSASDAGPASADADPV